MFKQEQRENKHLFKTRIISYHSTDVEARQKEKELHIKYDVVRSVIYMNESIAKPNGFHGRDVSGENNPMYGKSRKGEKHRGGENISRALKEKYKTDYGKKMREESSRRLKENNPSQDQNVMQRIKETWKETGRGIGAKNGMYGQVGKLKGKKLYNNGITVKGFIPGQQPDGWSLGRIKIDI